MSTNFPANIWALNIQFKKAACLPSLVSPSLSLFGAAPTVPPHTVETSDRLPETPDSVHFPMHQSGLLVSFQAKKNPPHDVKLLANA